MKNIYKCYSEWELFYSVEMTVHIVLFYFYTLDYLLENSYYQALLALTILLHVILEYRWFKGRVL